MARTRHSSFDTDALLARALRGELDEAQAGQLYRLGPEAVTLALLTLTRRIAELQPGGGVALTPATPSGMIPVYAKAAVPARRGRPGARNGHPGHRRPAPPRIDRRIEHRAACCPGCGGPLRRCNRARTRIIEDIPEAIPPLVTEHTLHRDYCPRCKKDVEPKVPDALPGAALGHRVLSLASWCHYGLGVTIDQLIDILQFHLQTRLSAGGLIDAWKRLADALRPWYEQIATQAKSSAHLHADETGWRVAGQTCWLWCFANGQVCYYMIDRCRGSPVLRKFFGDAFDGILLHDFWSAYESIDVADRQYCLVHLLRELEKVDQQRAAAPRAGDTRAGDTRGGDAEWQAFAQLLRRLIRDGIRLRKRPDFTPQKYRGRITRIGRRLDALIATPCADADATRLLKRLRRTGDHLFTFLDYPHIPFENNLAERAIRPAVILRKNSQSNRSQRGALTQAILMSVYRTLKLRGHDPLQTLENALRIYVQTGNLPPLPPTIDANG